MLELYGYRNVNAMFDNNNYSKLQPMVSNFKLVPMSSVQKARTRYSLKKDYLYFSLAQGNSR